MTPATISPSNTSPTPPNQPLAFSPAAAVRATAEQIIGIFQRSPEWIVIVFAWIAAGVLPVYWNMGEDHWWTEPDSPLFFQPFIPLVVAALLWHHRDSLALAYQETSRRKRHGSPWLIWVGCLVLLGAHFVHVLTFAALGLVIVAVGIVYAAYGLPVLIQASRYLAVGILFIPPPSSFVAKGSNGYGWFILSKAVIVAQKFGKQIAITNMGSVSSFDIAGHIVQIPHKQFSTVVFAVVALLIVSMWRRERVGPALTTMAVGAIFVAALTFIITLVALIVPVSPLTDKLLNFPPLLTAAVGVIAVVLVKRRMKVWQSGIMSSKRAIDQLSKQAQRATSRATAGVSASIGSGTRRAGQGMTRGTEAMIDGFVRLVTKPFKRKRRDRW